MEPWHWALLLKPLFVAVFCWLVLWPLVWLLDKLIPSSKLKAFLFKVRDGPSATKRDRIVHWVWSIGALAALIAVLGLMFGHGR